MVKSRDSEYRALGIMSGTSLDGLDLALCSFTKKSFKWGYKIEKAETITYSGEMKKLLAGANNLRAEAMSELDHYYGKWIGRQCIKFMEQVNPPDLIASHGHTVFHQPEKGFTLQIGNGNDIAAITGLPVVFDFRSLDVALGGQGAPLVPAGDEHLFAEFGNCLNLGGFSNISYSKDNHRIAFDICPVNIALNEISGRMNEPFDRNGEIARGGRIIIPVLENLNSIDFYKLPPPRSLGREWYENHFRKFLSGPEKTEDILRTLCEHITDQIAEVINKRDHQKTIITGGGAKNLFLMDLLRTKCKNNFVIPDDDTVDFKEALIFGFLGLLRYRNEINCYCSVTGAMRDCSAGVLVNPAFEIK